MKSKLAVVFDTFFIAFMFFIIAYFWLFKIIKNAFFTLFCSISLSVLLFYIFFKFFLKKYKLNKISFQDQKLAKNCIEKLMFMDTETLINFYSNLLNVKHIKGNIFTGTKSNFYISTKHKLDDKDFMLANDYYLKNKDKELSFIATSVSEEFTALMKACPTSYNLFSMADLFLIMKERNIFPENVEQSNQKTKRFANIKTKLSTSITKTHFKEFFFSGLSLILISTVIPFSSYYLIFGSILLSLALISLFIKNKNPTNVLSEKNLSTLIKDVTNK